MSNAQVCIERRHPGVHAKIVNVGAACVEKGGVIIIIMVIFKRLSLATLSALQDHEGGGEGGMG